MAHDEHHTALTNPEFLARKLDAAAWGVFFVWIGIALIFGIGWGVGLLGVGIITLGAQFSRRYVGLTFESFSMVVGLIFCVAGVWELLALQIGLVPVVLIIAGAALLLSAVRGTTARL